MTRLPPFLVAVPDVRFSIRALASLDRFDKYLRARNPRTADALLAEVEALSAFISDFPDLGKNIAKTNLRYVVTRKYRYRIVYGLRGQTLIVMDVLHPKAG